MTTQPLYILLASGEHEKIQLAGMVASVGAVSDRPVHVFVSMDAILAFRRGLSPAERYPHGGHFSQHFKTKNVPDAIELFKQGRMLGEELKMYACSMVMDLEGWELDDLEEDLFDEAMGLTMFLSAAEDGQLITL